MIGPYFFEKKKKVVRISGASCILAFCRLVAKMFKVVRRFIDWRVKQKILFEYGLQIWFFCNSAIGWLSKFPVEHPPKKSEYPLLGLAPSFMSNKFNIIIILGLFLLFLRSIKILSAFQGVIQKSISSYVTKCFTQFNCTFIKFHNQCRPTF